MRYEFDFSFLQEYWPDFAYGVFLTIEMTGAAIVTGLICGTLCAVAHTGSNLWLRGIVRTYVEIIRNTPLLVQAFWLFFGSAVMGLRLSAFEAAVIALTVNVTAYSSEIIRAGIETIHRGQLEAAASLGLSRSQMLFDVVLPPALEKVYPALTSQFIMMMLASAIMSQISAEELMAVAGRIQSQTFRGLEIYLVVAVLYIALSILFGLAFRCLAYLAFPRRRRLKTAG
jgi:polar amino acid transport system permease protein